MNYSISDQLKNYKGKIVWLASYPKSGNTWLRAFLSSLIYEDEFNINNLVGDAYFPSRALFEEVTDLDSTYLTFEEIKDLRHEIYKHICETSKVERMLFVKIHDLCDDMVKKCIAEGQTHSVIYLVRNPLSIVPSYANHLGRSIPKTIHVMNNRNGYLANPKTGIPSVRQLPQFTGSWSDHVSSWTIEKGFPVQVTRYEDMVADPVLAFSRILSNIGLDVDSELVQKSVENTSMDNLQKQEKELGFKEKPMLAEKFFRSGEIEAWHNKLTNKEQDLIQKKHFKMMKKFNYI